MLAGVDLSWVRFEHVRWVGLIALALGVALTSHATLSTIGEGLLLRARLRKRSPLLSRPAARAGGSTGRRRPALHADGTEPLRRRDASRLRVPGGPGHWTGYVPIVAGGLMALLAWDLLISSAVFVLGFGTSYVVEARQRLLRRRRLSRQAEVLIVKFRSMFDIENSIFLTLARVAQELPVGEVRQAVEACLQNNNSGRVSAAESFAPLWMLGDPHLRRLATGLARAGSASAAAFNAVLCDLEIDIGRQLQVEREAAVEMAAVKGTARTLQGAGLLAGLWAVVAPAWRAYFTATLHHRMLFIFLAAVVALGSVYLERELFAIERGEVE